MHKLSVGLLGASGYSGVELCKILQGHPAVEVRFLVSDRWEGDSVEARTDLEGPLGALRYQSLASALELAKACDVVFLATPAEASLELAAALLQSSSRLRLIDLSGAFRLQDAALYPSVYKLSHKNPSLLKEAVYGLCELGGREKARGARLIANPGCYATAAALSVAPLLRAGLVEADSLVINAASGVTGAGRKASEELSFCEVMDDFRAYKVLSHQHTPEIEQTLAAYSGAPASIVFTPHLLPLKRGILCTTVARAKPNVTEDAISAAFADAYGPEPFMRIEAAPEYVHLKSVVGTNRCAVGFSQRGRNVVVVSALDNLIKGAAGAAVQNFNLMLGLAEVTGLESLRAFHP